jgi:uncharacterized membrane protein
VDGATRILTMPTSPLRYRMAVAVLALVAALVALYLHLWKAGLTGPLTCTGDQGCQVAMMSPWGWFLGVDVALIGVVGYTAILGVALWGLQPTWAFHRAPSLALLTLIVPAVLFTLRLKYAEWFILRTFCIWCFESAVTIVLCLALAAVDWKRVATGAPAVRLGKE